MVAKVCIKATAAILASTSFFDRFERFCVQCPFKNLALCKENQYATQSTISAHGLMCTSPPEGHSVCPRR